MKTKMQDLLPKHYTDLKESGLSDKTIRKARLRSVGRREARKLIGRNRLLSEVKSALVFPYRSDSGFVRIKLFPPAKNSDGDKVKYLQARKSENHLYIPPGIDDRLADPSVPLFITEGEKKSLRGAQDGLCCVAISGVYSWKKKGSERLIEDIANLTLNGRKIFLIPDSDFSYNSDIRQAMLRFWSALEKKHARVRLMCLPQLDGNKKTGLDDFLTARSVNELTALPTFRSKTEILHHPKAPPPRAEGDGAKEPEPVSFGSLREPKPRKPLLGGLLAKGYPNLLYANGGQGKSYLAMRIASAFARGEKFLGYEIPRWNVLYLDWELSQREQLRRAFNVARGMGHAAPPDNLHYRSPTRTFPELISQVKEWIAKYDFKLIVVDSVGIGSGINTEAAQEVTALFSQIRTLRTTVILIDHQPKVQGAEESRNKLPFGSNYKWNLARSVIHLTTHRGSKSNRPKLILEHKKTNFGLLVDSIGIRVHFRKNGRGKERVSYRLCNAAADRELVDQLAVRSKVLASLCVLKEATSKKISEHSGVSYKSVQNCLPELRTDGKARKLDRKDGKQTIWALVVPEAV